MTSATSIYPARLDLERRLAMDVERATSSFNEAVSRLNSARGKAGVLETDPDFLAVRKAMRDKCAAGEALKLALRALTGYLLDGLMPEGVFDNQFDERARMAEPSWMAHGLRTPAPAQQRI